MPHRTRVLPIRQQTMLANAFRAHLAEFGIVVVQGIRHVCELYGSSAARRAANGTQITDQVDRKGTPCLASDKPGKPAVGNDPRSELVDSSKIKDIPQGAGVMPPFDDKGLFPAPSAPDIKNARLRFLACRLPALGPAPIYHFLTDIESGKPLLATLEEYAALPADFIKAYGGDEFAAPFAIGSRG